MSYFYNAIFCDHSQMKECCSGSGSGCGHFSCPCGVYWDDGAEGSFSEDYDDDPNNPRFWEEQGYSMVCDSSNSSI